jgi:hypothetical protein
VALKTSAAKLADSSPNVAPTEPDATEPRRKSERPERLEPIDIAVERDLARILARALVQQFMADSALPVDTQRDTDAATRR